MLRNFSHEITAGAKLVNRVFVLFSGEICFCKVLFEKVSFFMI